ncbi:MAG: putative cytosine-specific methyltransferase [Prokaryotic dsDNA virus sp.]|nr:MAG: putative cytosine-specific methyltransferase [Prokaryotic dsDNA virus sp.]|tara:strand:- start:2796 stop:3995 length:1200 start_codon:yes stop_codon:yes gene_type:complete
MIKVGTDFSGIGAPEQALKQLGIEHRVKFACDVDKWAKKSYLSNYNPEIFYDDITAREQKNTPYVDLYVAGFPCQAFSIAGKRKGFEDTRGTLFFDLLQYIQHVRPKYFILENVKGLVNHDKGNTYRTIMECLKETKYRTYAKVLNTKHFGIPQNRERIFIVGFRDEHYFEWPQHVNLEIKIKHLLESNVEEKYFLKEQQIEKLKEYNKRNEEKGNGFRAKFHDTEGIMSALKVGGARADDLIEVRGCALRTWPRKSSADANQDRQKRLEFRSDNVVNTITTHSLDSMVGEIEWIADVRTDEGLRIRENGLSPCLTASKNSASEISRSAPLVKEKKQNIRRLTPLECLRLQGFEDVFFKNCKDNDISDTQLYKQAGNSMSVNVLKGIIKKILENEKRYI